ncbi:MULTISPECIES: AI-2E family transporter [Natrinema]|nr:MULTISPECIES: AI-2E family transporter [Natrinema]AFO56385.2 hypothetical protein NJ7G_1138 [Natrinema sp. J7-2]
MVDRASPSDWVVEQPVLTTLALISVALGFLVVLPYLQYVLFGIVLAYILLPLQRRLEEYLRPTVAASITIIVAVLVIVLPLVYILTVALRQTSQLVTAVRNGGVDLEMVERTLAERGYSVNLTGLYESYQDAITSGVQGLATGVLDIVGGLPGIAIGVTITLFVCFALLRDGEQLVEWLYRVVPIDDAIQRELLAELDHLMQASVISNVLVAAIQAVLLGAGLAVLGMPAVVLLTVLTFVLTLLPLVGSFGVWLPVSIYLVALNRPVAAVGLTLYGLLVMISDTYLRPALIGRTSAFNSTIAVVGIFGGLITFGAVGLFIGPVVLGGVKVVLDIFAREHTGGPGPEPGAAGGTGTSADASDSDAPPVTRDAETGPPPDGTDVDTDGDDTGT